VVVSLNFQVDLSVGFCINRVGFYSPIIFFKFYLNDDDGDDVFRRTEAHLTILVLDVTTMRLRNFRKDIDLVDEQLYDRCLHDDIVSAEV